jgi:hypothetical protein
VSVAGNVSGNLIEMQFIAPVSAKGNTIAAPVTI